MGNASETISSPVMISWYSNILWAEKGETKKKGRENRSNVRYNHVTQE